MEFTEEKSQQSIRSKNILSKDKSQKSIMGKTSRSSGKSLSNQKKHTPK